MIKCFDKNGQELHLNDYVLIKTNIGMHEGYVRGIGRDKVHVNCLVGEFWIAPNNIYKKSYDKFMNDPQFYAGRFIFYPFYNSIIIRSI